jgi:signal transduction histidine kinase/CheY-like chemotaxis protein
MRRSIARSISRKVMLVVLATTFMALLISGVAMLLYDVHAYRNDALRDLVTQADILGRSSAPALQFNDPATARGNLQLLRVRPNIVEAAIYAGDGKLFASYDGGNDGIKQFPPAPKAEGYRIEGNTITISHRIVENSEVIGTLYLRAHYEVRERLTNYLIILLAVMFGSLLIAAVIAAWLQAAVTAPLLEVTGVARDVMRRRDYSLRAKKTTRDEIGVLVDAFNDMLGEVERRAGALEQSNRDLEREMKERRDAEHALRIADRRKDEFLATLAHELRNPLAPLSNGLTLLRLAGNDPAIAKNARDIMERQLTQMVRLVDDLIDVSRISTGRLAIKKERIELQAVVRNAVEIVTSFIEKRGHVLQIDLPAQPVWIDADPTRLAQVFSNLLNNAAKYTDQGGNIAFQAELEEASVVVRVMDNGIGIPAEMLATVFDMFTQVDKSLERSQAGLGVGLTLARRLVELHGGTLKAQSRGRGQGSCFVIQLPLATDIARDDGRSSGAAEEPPLVCHRILLADDNIDFALTLATLLRGLGHEVLVTHDGEQALQVAEGFRPDFAFLDIGLPKRNGYELARGLRESAVTVRSILVAVTGWGQEKDRQLAAQAGFDHHLVKPVQLAQIQEILRQRRR